MHPKLRLNNSRYSHRAWLYSVVFTSKISALAVLFLFVSFFIQPLHKAIANEQLPDEPPKEEPVTAEPVKEQVEPEPVVDETPVTVDAETPRVAEDSPAEVVAVVEDEPEADAEPLSPIDEEGEPVAVATPEVDSETVSAVASSSPTAEEVAPVSDEVASTTTVVEPPSAATSTVASSTSPSESVTVSGSGSGSGGGGTAGEVTPTDDVLSVGTATDESAPVEAEDVTSGSGSSAETAAEEPEVPSEDVTVGADKPLKDKVVEAQYLVTEENYYQFSRQSCAPVGDGTYHCSLKTGVTIDPQAVVYADKGTGGNMEIFLRTSKGKVEQITDNDFDDTAPHFDAKSMRIVWQRLVDGRYQVIVYDLLEKTEVQLTFSRTNNMEPKVAEEGIVWQAWDGNDWEIMYFDGTYTDQLTDNDSQDVTPVVEDGYVLWSILGGSAQEARVYSLETKQVMTIASHEGGAIANPRFVLVYDTKFDNGDIITQGFDPATGLSAPIAAQAAPEPVQIPETDTTGEIRALIQNKSSQKEKDVVKLTPSTDAPSDLNLIASSSATSSDTLNLKQPLDMIDLENLATSTTSNIESAVELTEFDLVITKTASSAKPLPKLATTTEKLTATSTQP